MLLFGFSYIESTEEQSAIDRQKILNLNEWRVNYDHYIPDQSIIAVIKNRISQDLSAIVYFGFWCSDSQDNVPVFLKIIDQLNIPISSIKFIEIEKKKSIDQQYYSAENQITHVPTFVFIKKSKEIGRIVEKPKKDFLEDLLLILF